MTVDPTIEGLYVRRRFEAPAERVFDAWTNPDLARQWLFPIWVGEVLAIEMDARPGGVFRVTGARHQGFGEILEMDRPRRLVLAFGVPAQGSSLDRLVAEITPDGTGCLLSVTKEGLPPDLAEETEADWGVMFDGLAAAIR
ncbi:SRPBCC family protein [Roseomonas chloroacetimidivorans]|jgi:uncharacterized protein YndB with AHSA1/START domain|uniref:SRPBCC family protein n=1 Tax=Roseomonas chloroacetimidivorans TaxID=1766656 RepID=UPI003C74CDC5